MRKLAPKYYIRTTCPIQATIASTYWLGCGLHRLRHRLSKLMVVQEVSSMGEWSEFEPGHRAPNSGRYREVGENDRIMGINDPQIIELEKGQRFPKTKNKNRKWVKM